MILVFDVGNTNTVIGVYQGKELRNHWRIKTDAGRTSDEYGMLLQNLFNSKGLAMDSIKAVAISSVVPSLMMELEMMSQQYFSCVPMVVGPGIKTDWLLSTIILAK
jgi:type III pantothenate kinase